MQLKADLTSHQSVLRERKTVREATLASKALLIATDPATLEWKGSVARSAYGAIKQAGGHLSSIEGRINAQYDRADTMMNELLAQVDQKINEWSTNARVWFQAGMTQANTADGYAGRARLLESAAASIPRPA
ncbi:MAG: hypothetical protein ACOYNI_09020 [Acidimicrobiia bacterium]